MNTLMGIIFLFNVSGGRYGIDYIAYLQQAAAVWNGETNYVKLSSNLGPCFYPAGHIWHYIPAVWLHLATEHAETIIKFGHLLIHSLINLFVGKIAYMYFRDILPKLQEASPTLVEVQRHNYLSYPCYAVKKQGNIINKCTMTK